MPLQRTNLTCEPNSGATAVSLYWELAEGEWWSVMESDGV